MLSTAWNRWTTKRRYQERGPCFLGCPHGDDSVEHYARCPVAVDAGTRWLGLRRPLTPLIHHWVLGAPDCGVTDATPHYWARLALLIYAVYRTTNAARPAHAPLSPPEAARAIRQALLEGARGCPTAIRLLSSR